MKLKERIEKAEKKIPGGSAFHIPMKLNMIAILRDEDGNIKETREVEYDGNNSRI